MSLHGWHGSLAALIFAGVAACGGQEASSPDASAIGDGESEPVADAWDSRSEENPVTDTDREAGRAPDARNPDSDASPADTAPSCADAGYDGPAWGPGDFSSYRWSFVGTGVTDSFFMDRDCGIDAQDLAGGDARSGVVAAGDCNDFKALAVSSRELGALSSDCVCMPRATDDEENTQVVLVGGATYGRHTSGCEETEPFHSTITKMFELESKYLSSDAGADSDAPAD